MAASLYDYSGPYPATAGAAVGIGKVVKWSSGEVIQATAGTDVMFGIALDAATAQGDRIGVQIARGSVARAVVNGSGTAIAVWDPLTATTAGVLIKTTTSGNRVIARALAASTASGDIIPVVIVDEVVA